MSNRILAPLRWAQKHWLALLLILLVLWLLDTFFFYVFSLFKRINALAGAFLPASAAAALARGLTAGFNLAAHNPWWLIVALIILFPWLGWLSFAWFLFDRGKTSAINPIAPQSDQNSSYVLPNDKPGG